MSAPARPTTVLFVGVGGQGTLTAARLLGDAVHRRGEVPVVVSQLHGMSQRGGSVQAATVVGSPEVLPPGSSRVDVLVGFELLEAVRAAPRLDAQSTVLCNRWRVLPPASASAVPAPSVEALCAELERQAGRCHFLDAMALAKSAGSLANVNVVLLGALTRLPGCPATAEDLLAAIRERAGGKQWELNQRLFALGRGALTPSMGALE